MEQTTDTDEDGVIWVMSLDGKMLKEPIYISGSDADHVSGVKLARDGSIYFVGGTGSADLPEVGRRRTHYMGGRDAFVGGVGIEGSRLLFLEYLGGSNEDRSARGGIAISDMGMLFVVGTTASADFPVGAAALQREFGGGFDGFVARLTMDGELTASTFLGGSGDAIFGNDFPTAVATQGQRLIVGGETSSWNFPLRGEWSNTQGPVGSSAFLSIMSTDLRHLWHSGVFGSERSDRIWSLVAVDAGTGVVVGSTNSDIGGWDVLETVMGIAGGTDGVVATMSLPVCLGDCNLDNSVTVEEVVRLVSIGLGVLEIEGCEAGDANGDDRVTVEEIVSAVNAALVGCLGL